MSRAMDVLMSQTQVWCGHLTCPRCKTDVEFAPGTSLAEVVTAARHECPNISDVLAEVLASVEGKPTADTAGGHSGP